MHPNLYNAMVGNKRVEYHLKATPDTNKPTDALRGQYSLKVLLATSEQDHVFGPPGIIVIVNSEDNATGVCMDRQIANIIAVQPLPPGDLPSTTADEALLVSFGGDLDAMAESRVQESLHNRLNHDRINSLLPGNPEIERLHRLVDGMEIFLPEGFKPNG